MRPSLRTAILGLSALAVLAIALAGYFFNLAGQAASARRHVAEHADRLLAAAATITLESLVVDDLATADQSLHSLNEDGFFERLALLDANVANAVLEVASPWPETRAAPEWFVSLLDLEIEPRRVPVVAAPVVYGYLEGKPASVGLQNELWQSALILLESTALALAVLLALLAAILHQGLKPVRALAAAAQRFGGGSLSVRMADTRIPEIAPTVKAFNTMADNVARLMDELRAKEAANRRLAAIVEQSEEVIVMLDPDGTITRWNTGAQRLLGYAREEIEGEPLARLVAAEDGEGPDPLRRLLEARPPLRVDIGLRAREGRMIPVAASASPFFDEAGAPAGHILVVRDVTRRQQAERELKRARDDAESASRAKGDFLATMSHEIRTPLNAIVGLAQLLRSARTDGAKRDDYLAKIDIASHTLLDLITGILDMSKIEAGALKLEQADFDPRRELQAIERVHADMAGAKGLSFSLTISEEVPEALRGDPVRLRQVASNFVSNAIKFTAHGGVSVRLLAPAPGRVRLEVSDTGIGIDPAQQARVFEPFTQADSSTTRRYGGTGLGLTLCRQLVELMGGSVGVQSRPGEGSTFWADMPLPEGDASKVIAPPHGEAPHPASDLQGARVLLVEDNDINRIVASAALATLGVAVTAVPGGREAIDEIDVRGNGYDAVLMDVQMPDMDGFETAAQLRRRHTPDSLPIIAMSAAAFAEVRQRSLDAGMNDFIAKPFDMSRLESVMRHWATGQHRASRRAGPAA